MELLFFDCDQSVRRSNPQHDHSDPRTRRQFRRVQDDLRHTDIQLRRGRHRLPRTKFIPNRLLRFGQRRDLEACGLMDNRQSLNLRGRLSQNYSAAAFLCQRTPLPRHHAQQHDDKDCGQRTRENGKPGSHSPQNGHLIFPLSTVAAKSLKKSNHALLHPVPFTEKRS